MQCNAMLSAVLRSEAMQSNGTKCHAAQYSVRKCDTTQHADTVKCDMSRYNTRNTTQYKTIPNSTIAT
eukprot:scaffold21097_cov42-Prasinocladus_malaysianus.AAC.1